MTETLTLDSLNMIDSPTIKGQEDKYETVIVDVKKVIENWRSSLFAHSWVTPDGRMKTLEELSEVEQERRTIVEQRIQGNETIERPVLGIGILDNVEIGSGRSTFVTLAEKGLDELSVHIRLSNAEELKPFVK